MNNYYNENAKEFINDTFNCDMSELYKFFEEKLNNKNTVLDLGFGSGRDSLYFMNKGYEVYSLDPIKEFCDNAKKLGLKNIYQMNAQDIEFDNMFDGIWACASLLHIPSNELNEVFIKCAKSLKKDGIMYASFKLGEFEGERNGRFFNDMNKNKLLPLLNGTGLNIIEEKITIDVRPDKTTEWYNVIVKRNYKEQFVSYEDRKIRVLKFYSDLGIKVKKNSEDLAVQSLTMREYNKVFNDKFRTQYYDNTSLSTLGDAICGAYVMRKEFKCSLTQEDLTNKKEIVTNENLNVIGERILKDILFSHNNDLKEGNKKAYATAFEAFIGFVYLVNRKKAYKILEDHLGKE